MRHPLSLLLASLLTLAASAVADAQPRCKKGIPCGNTRIAANRVCRTGNGAATRAPAPPSSPAPVAVPASSAMPASDSAAAGATLMRPLVSSEADRWVALPGGSVYYRASCEAARELPLELLISYPSEAVAQRAGLRRSKVQGC